MDSKNIFYFFCTELQNPPEIHASRLEYSLKVAEFISSLSRKISKNKYSAPFKKTDYLAVS